MSEAESLLSHLENSVSIPLHVLSGRHFLEMPTSDNLNGSTVKLKCSVDGFTELFRNTMIMDDEKHLSLPLCDGEEEEDREQEIGWRRYS